MQIAHLMPEVNGVPWAANPVNVCSEPRHICLQPKDPCYELFDGLQKGNRVTASAHMCLSTFISVCLCDVSEIVSPYLTHYLMHRHSF